MLKTAVLCTFSLFASLASASAQSAFDVGLKAGPARATMSGPEFANTGSRTGLTAGVSARLFTSHAIWVQPELLFSSKGVRLTDASEGGPASVRINYLEVPFLVGVSPFRGRPMGVEIFGGPVVGLRTGTRLTADAGGSNTEYNIDDQVKKGDVGVAIGGGVRIGGSSVEVRITQGVRNVATSAFVTSARNRSISVMYGFMWRGSR